VPAAGLTTKEGGGRASTFEGGLNRPDWRTTRHAVGVCVGRSAGVDAAEPEIDQRAAKVRPESAPLSQACDSRITREGVSGSSCRETKLVHRKKTSGERGHRRLY